MLVLVAGDWLGGIIILTNQHAISVTVSQRSQRSFPSIFTVAENAMVTVLKRSTSHVCLCSFTVESHQVTCLHQVLLLSFVSSSVSSPCRRELLLLDNLSSSRKVKKAKAKFQPLDLF